MFEASGEELSGFAFVVRSMKLDFFKPGYMDDVIDVIAAPEVKRASIALHQQCRRGADLLVETRVRVAFVSAGKAQRIPEGCHGSKR
ncbi:acyl-CoA thioesterase FadM [Bradyrhizobium sp. i1.15.2]